MYIHLDDDEKSEITLLKYYNDVRGYFDIERLKFNNYYLLNELRQVSKFEDILIDTLSSVSIIFNDEYITRIKKLIVICNINIYNMTQRLGKVPKPLLDDYTEIYNELEFN
jgi:hypothetical protein